MGTSVPGVESVRMHPRSRPLQAVRPMCGAGKWRKPGVAAFLAHPEREVLRCECELLAGAWRPGRYVEIAVRDPKPRRVSAAPFRDRMVHLRCARPWCGSGARVLLTDSQQFPLTKNS